MRTEYEPERAAFSDKAHEAAKRLIYPLIFKTGYHIGPQAVAVLWFETGIEGAKTRGKHHRPDFEILDDRLHLMVDRLGHAGVHTAITLAADAAFEAALSFGQRLRFAEP